MQDAMHEILGTIPDIMPLCFFVFLCTYQYVPSTYQVQTRFIFYIHVKVLEFKVQTSMYSLAVGTVLHLYVPCYSFIMIPPATALERYLPQCATVQDPGDFLILIWYLGRLDLHSYSQLLALCRSGRAEYQIGTTKSPA